jgi:hypothetical protein
MTFGLVGALGWKVRPTVTTSMILPLNTKCLMRKSMINVSFTSMVDSKKKKTRLWPQSFVDLKTFIKQVNLFSIFFSLRNKCYIHTCLILCGGLCRQALVVNITFKEHNMMEVQ